MYRKETFNNIKNISLQEDLEVRKEKYHYMYVGLPLIKIELHEDWIEQVDEFLHDKTDKTIFDITFICLKELKNNASCESITTVFDETLLTPEMINQIVSKLIHFSPRGEEFKEYWNKANPDNHPKRNFEYKLI